MGYQKASAADIDSVIDEEWGGMWFLKDALATGQVGLTILELEPGGKGKEHDHSHDGQEEVYCCVEGAVDVQFGDEQVTLRANEAVRIDPETTRQIQNNGDERAKLVLVGAPL